MAFSYSAINGYGKSTLPSVEAGLGSLNIIKEPKKGITTRRIDKVGFTNDITQMIQDSGDRACEGINVYARGVNPMVAVNYSNIGGSTNGNIQVGGPQQGRLPYALDVFRPPVQRQENLYPLSRLPRNNTSAFSQPGFVDFSKSMSCNARAEPSKTIKQDIIKTFVKPTATYKIEKPLQEPFEVKYVIQPTINVSATSGVRTLDITTQEVKKPTKEIDNNPLHTFALSNKNKKGETNNHLLDSKRYLQEAIHNDVHANASFNADFNKHTIDSKRYLQEAIHNDVHANASYNADINKHTIDSKRYLQEAIHNDVHANASYNADINKHTIDSKRYLQEAIHNDVTSNKRSRVQQTSIDDILDLGQNKINQSTKDINTTDYTTPIFGGEKVTYIHDDIELDRNLPEYNAQTNITKNMQKILLHDKELFIQRHLPTTTYTTNIISKGTNSDHANRDYKNLVPKVNAGSFNNSGTIPKVGEHNIPNIKSQKNALHHRIASQQNGRNNNIIQAR